MPSSIYTAVATALLAANVLAAPHPCACTRPVIGLGFDLTATSGFVSAKFPNGTVLDLGELEGSDAYRSFYSKPLPQPTFAPCTQQGQPFSLRKFVSKARNFILHGNAPALCQIGPDLSPLTDFLSSLEENANEALVATGDPIVALSKDIVITSRHLPNIQLDRASAIAGMTWSATVPELEAAYRDALSSEDLQNQAEIREVGEDAKELVLTVRYTDDQLVIKAVNFINGHIQNEVPSDELSELALPHQIPGGHCEKSREIADIVKAKIQAAMPCSGGEISRVLFLGDRSSDADFLDGAEVAMGLLGWDASKLMVTPRQWQEEYPKGFMAARGAAALAMRVGTCVTPVEVVVITEMADAISVEVEVEQKGNTIEVEIDLVASPKAREIEQTGDASSEVATDGEVAGVPSREHQGELR